MAKIYIGNIEIKTQGEGLSQAEKNLLLTLFEKSAYADNDAGTAYTALSELWAGYDITWVGSGYTKSNSATSVSAGDSFTSTVTANTGFTISSVSVTMGGNTVQGAWINGRIMIPNVTGNIVITVTTSQVTVSSISAVFTQSGAVYEADSLDSLKADLVVTATFMDSSTGVIASEDYTLSGTLTEGTSTITVSYGGKTATFNVTVTAVTPFAYGLLNLSNPVTGSYIDDTGEIQTATSNSGYYEDYVDVRSISAFELHSPATVSGDMPNIRISIYDANKSFVRQVRGNYSAGGGVYASVTLNSNEKYIRLGWYANTAPAIYIESTTPISLAMEHGDIDGSTGADKTHQYRIRSTDYIEASGTITVQDSPLNSWSNFVGTQGGGYFFRCFDSNKQIVGSLTNNNALYKADIANETLPTGTAYVRVLFHKNAGFATGYTANIHPFSIDGKSYLLTEAD